MKIQAKLVDGNPEVILSEVYSGVGIQTDAGLFGIAQRDGGIEVLLNGKTVWAMSGDAHLGSTGPVESGRLQAAFHRGKEAARSAAVAFAGRNMTTNPTLLGELGAACMEPLK